jgi:hypothetical protein
VRAFWKHNLAGGIRPICDIAETTRYYGDAVDWTKVANTSAEWEMNAGSYLVLSLARELLDAPIPKDFLNEVRPVNFNMDVIHWARESVMECPLVFPDLVKLFWKGRFPAIPLPDTQTILWPPREATCTTRYA